MAASTSNEASTAVVEDATVRPFRVEVPQEDLDDLRRRIGLARWPSRELVTDRSQGVQLATLQELARYWASDYDLRRIEARLNALPQFTTTIDGAQPATPARVDRDPPPTPAGRPRLTTGSRRQARRVGRA